jgi:hypothetical protein
VDGDDAAEHSQERGRNDRRDQLEPEDDDESGDADDEREPAGRAELAQQVPELLEELALALLDAEELRQLPNQVSASVIVSCRNRSASWPARSPTAAAESAAVDAIGPTARWRELPHAA